MSPGSLSDRVIGALRLAPMTTAQLATCLSANYWSVKSALVRLDDAGLVASHRIHKRQNLFELRSV